MGIPWADLVAGVKGGDVRALARMITRVENRDPGWKGAMKEIYPDTGGARVFGITGAPGSGKSSLTNRIALGLAERGFRLGIIAVDPSSPFSGGALLGDRLRMRDVSARQGIFIRSMATRGSLGGLCQGAREVVRILEASGKDIVLIETVGVGQDEIEIVKAADLVVVVCVPGLGDGIQTLKAGIMEIADLFLVNKCDRGGADEVVSDITSMLALTGEADGRRPPVLKTSTLTGEGMEVLVDTLVEMKDGTGRWTTGEEECVKEEILVRLETELSERIRSEWEMSGEFKRAVSEVMAGREDPYSVVDEMLSGLLDSVFDSGRQRHRGRRKASHES